MGLLKRLQGWALRDGGGSCVALLWGADLVNLAGHSMLVSWVDFQAQVAKLSLLASQKTSARSLQPGLQLLSTPAGPDSDNQQSPGGTTPPRTSLMLRVFVWVFAAPEGSLSVPKTAPPAAAQYGARVCRNRRSTPALAAAPQPDLCAYGSRRGHLGWPGSSRVSPMGGFNTPTLLGTTDFTLRDPKHRIL